MSNIWIAFGVGIFIGMIVTYGSLAIIIAANDYRIRRRYNSKFKRSTNAVGCSTNDLDRV